MSAVDFVAAPSMQGLMQRYAQLSATFAPVRTTASVASNASFSSALDAASADITSLTGTASTTSVATTTAADPVAATSGSGSSSGVTGADVVASAEKYLGVPYVLGGTSMSGIDCSGLVQRAYGDLGITTSRLVHTQKLEGTEVPSLSEAEPGDLIVTKGGAHIMIYVGDNKVIQAPMPGRKVDIKELWIGDSGIETIRRILPDTAAAAPASATTLSADTSALNAQLQAQIAGVQP